MAPTNTTKEINIQLKPTNQVIDVVKYLTYDPLYKSHDVVLITLTCMPKARLEVASISSIIQYSCDIVLSGHVHDVVFDFSHVRIPFTWPNKSIREILYANHVSPIALELVSRDCRLTVFRKNDHSRRDDWYDQIKNWRKDLPNRFHLMLNELVENVSAHAKLEEGRFCFTVGLLFANKKLYYCVADSGVGLRGSLKEAIVSEAKDVASRACALHLTRAQFTSKGIERGHQGVGLFITSELAQMNKGYLEILSGSQAYEQCGISEWKGTMVRGMINLDQEFNYRQAMKLFSDPSKLANDRFLVSHIHLNVYGQRTLRTRELCEEIIRDLELAAERSTKLILDTDQIDEISQAFHGFLKQFIVKHSHIQILIKIPPTADEDLKEDLQELIELAAKNNPSE
ncbi:11879_t:CDS:2 [Gigaspora margarita]|uniref:11879_t:CDS:1 n=1 Tax=Gigaspora margarita TaxID=4874 RepID=A0ABN7W4F3_GIGMA|nr:11879_t:CDS:2 [Gigaspora margarita]